MTDILPNTTTIIHLFSDVSIRITHIFQKLCAQTRKKKENIKNGCTHITPTYSCLLYNRVFWDNSPVGYWIKGGQRGDIAQSEQYSVPEWGREL